MNREQNSGTTDIATRYDAASASTTPRAKGAEQVFADPGEEDHREEHDRRGEGGGQHRQLRLPARLVRLR